MKKISLVLEIPPQSWMAHIQKIHGISHIRLLDCIPCDDGSMNEFFEICCSPEAMPEVVKALQTLRGVKDIEITLKVSSHKIVGSLRTTQCNLCRHFSSSECFLGSAIYEMDRGRLRWSFYVREQYIPQLFSALEKEGIGYEVEHNASIGVAEELTPFQEKLLYRALQEGYLDIPKKADLNRLAEEFGTTKASLSVTFRRALKKVVRAYLEQAKP